MNEECLDFVLLVLKGLFLSQLPLLEQTFNVHTHTNTLCIPVTKIAKVKLWDEVCSRLNHFYNLNSIWKSCVRSLLRLNWTVLPDSNERLVHMATFSCWPRPDRTLAFRGILLAIPYFKETPDDLLTLQRWQVPPFWSNSTPRLEQWTIFFVVKASEYKQVKVFHIMVNLL